MPEAHLMELPIITLRETVMFPHAVMTFHVGRPASLSAINSAMIEYNKLIFLVAQTNAAIERPDLPDLFKVGVVSRVLRVDRLQDNTVKLTCEGLFRATWLPLNASSHFGDRAFPRLRVVSAEETLEEDAEIPAVVEALQDALSEACRKNRRITPDQLSSFALIEDPGELADAVAPILKADFLRKQAILEVLDGGKRLRQVYECFGGELITQGIDKAVKSRVKAQMEQSQKEYYLTEQLKAIHKELGHDDAQTEIAELEEKLKAKNMPEEARERALREVKKLRQMPQAAPEYVIVRNYVDWILDLPWNDAKTIDINLSHARSVLDGEHFGLEKAKTRILEYLAVQKLSGSLKGPILCLVGPPGVGKTSLAKSIAHATGRDFVRISLGGVRDEAEIRGHRRTYIGALPGKIIMALKRVKHNNPLFCLDEIDKMTADFRGDPASALLEVLDPEQNCAFNDHYLDIDYDLSQVFFITTANSMQNIPAPLLDRMEVLELPSYLEGEKVHIARDFLLPRQWKMHGIKPENMDLSHEALLSIIRSYTREAGVRNLERQIAALCRKTAMRLVDADTPSLCVPIDAHNLEDFLGVKQYRFDEKEARPQAGVAAGLAYTGAGGDILYIETAVMPGSGKIQVTGKLGDVMKESAHAAFSYIRSRSSLLGLKPNFYKDIDIHVHVPEGAVPKDGPSAGITLATAILSALLGIYVRDDVCMTGEITLRGRVLPIGGLREKLLAASRAGMHTVLVPEDNKKDIKDVPEEIVRSLNIIFVRNADEVLPIALLAPKEEIFSGEDTHALIHSLRAPHGLSHDVGAVL